MDILDRIDILLNEVTYKKVVRKGKLVKKGFCPPGYKFSDGKCKKQSAAEHRKRSISTKKSRKKIKGGKFTKMLKKMKKSLKKREAFIPSENSAE